nr:N-6 DNA methylase [Kaistella haifensis]
MSEPLAVNSFVEDISIIEGTRNEVIIFKNDKDRTSFLELLKLNNQSNHRTLITLRSDENTPKLISQFHNYDGKIFLCLPADQKSNLSTQKIISELQGKNIKDVRLLYGISENGHQNLEEYLRNKLNFENKNITLAEQKNSEDENLVIKSNGFSNSQHLGTQSPGRNIRKPFQNGESQQNGNHTGRQNVGSDDARNGFAGTERSDLGNGKQGGYVNGTQPQNAPKNERARNFVDGIVSAGTSENPTGEKLNESNKNNEELNSLISKYKGQKLTNEQVAEVVSATCFVSDEKKILLKDNVNISDDLKEICHQFKSGGTAKEGRGILDEYYTDYTIVNAVRNLIKDHFKNRSKISVLEPSVGTGNFLNAAKDLGIKTNITAFEINETTAKIAKILHPEADFNLRSFETEFIDERGNKKVFSDQYDLVVGNPPYGDHRGLYKGLGEEAKISKYEDYFLKRSLDSLKPNGILAMVLPSGWLNRQNHLKNGEIIEGFRLPVGVFAGTQVGTDIIILRKNNQKIYNKISNYFENHPERILGEIKEKTNRFGRLENYVHGNLEDALIRIENLKNRKETERIGNLFEDLFLEVEEEKKVKKSVKTEKLRNNSEEDLKTKKKIDFSELNGKVEQVLIALNSVKFKSPAVEKEIAKYTQLQSELSTNPQDFAQKRIDDLTQKADKIIQSQKEKDREYHIQIKPELKKGILKYQFLKPDKVVDASLQNSSAITKEQVEAFRETEYDGTLNNYGKHYQFANYWMENGFTIFITPKEISMQNWNNLK